MKNIESWSWTLVGIESLESSWFKVNAKMLMLVIIMQYSTCELQTKSLRHRHNISKVKASVAMRSAVRKSVLELWRCREMQGWAGSYSIHHIPSSARLSSRRNTNINLRAKKYMMIGVGDLSCVLVALLEVVRERLRFWRAVE